MQNNLFIDTIKGIKRERPPVWFMRQAGRVLPSYMKLRETYSFRELMLNPELTAEVTLLPVYDLGVDAAILFSDILVIPEALGMNLKFTEHGPLFEPPLLDTGGRLHKLSPVPSKLEHIYKAIDLIKIKKPDDVALIGFCGSPFTTFCYMVQGSSANHTFSEAISLLYSDKKTSSKILEQITELSIEYAVNQAEHGIDAFQLFETHAGLIPSDAYIEFILPYVKKITTAVMEKNVPVIFFPKGLGLGISSIKRDIADFVSIDWQYSMEDVRKIIDREVGVQGNLDPRLLSLENNDYLKHELTKFVPFGEKEFKWIFNTGHGLSPDNSLENVKFTVDWIKNTNWLRN